MYTLYSGVFQLADPRVTPGTSRTAWDSVTGIAAIAKNCPNIENLDLSGCFRLNISIQRYVSCLTSLKTLNLSGCPLSSDTVVAVGQNCPLITDINLSDCGRGINGIGIKTISSNCKGLRTINLGEDSLESSMTHLQ